AGLAADRWIGGAAGGRRLRAGVSCGERFERRGARGGPVCAPFVGTAGCPSRAASRRGAHFTAGTGTGRGMG
ncbi:hypothetical protein, partial [Burkholderia vietnamiensis]|uniref:hypothetical protein n=1 Tax=Burkholderia vietnamiensis TaxID=60552 RepID=UPI001CC6D4A8